MHRSLIAAALFTLAYIASGHPAHGNSDELWSDAAQNRVAAAGDRRIRPD
jgi:hypothetical protein